ncbi:MAG: aspartate--tRNA ligase [Actinomycetota bacterium]
MMRTHEAGTLRAENEGEQVTLCGWVHHRRDHGKVAFLDLRDASGTVQVVAHPEHAPEAHEAMGSLQREWCVKVTGKVAKRKEGTQNPKLATGDIEISAEQIEVLSSSDTPPFLIEDSIDAEERMRLQYRYLDLRRPEMQTAIRLRASLIAEIRRFLDGRRFVEIETPTLILPTPEGARDFLVPSRLQPGSAYALPQSPQLFKQLLMVGGFERYYQIARCWRDEDLRADRQLEFTQLDLEMSFVEEADIQALMEELMAYLWREVMGVDLETPFPRMTYAECMRRYGSDKPDVRFGMELVDVTKVFADTQLGIFRGVIDGDGAILAIGAPGGASKIDKKEVKRLEQLAKERGAKGLAWLRFTSEGLDSPLAKHLSEAEQAQLLEALGCTAEDSLVLMVADARSVGETVLGAMRLEVAERLDIIPLDQWSFLWMTDPPLFEWDEEEQRYVSVHHPFTQPAGSLEDVKADPANAKARAYDLVLNGVELGGGSIRIHRRDTQIAALEVLGRDPSEFSFLLEAFRYGPPPHGGIALGLDRMAMLAARRGSLRDVIAFPKTQSGTDPMTGAPGAADPRAYRELHIASLAKSSGS